MNQYQLHHHQILQELQWIPHHYFHQLRHLLKLLMKILKDFHLLVPETRHKH
jgi:hypothetical protein